MRDALRWLSQAAFYAAFFLPLAYLTHAPPYRALPPDMAVLKVAIRHAGAIVGACTTPGAGKFDDRPINMRPTKICPRERSPLALQLILDGETLYRATVPASGLHNDQLASVYRRFNVPAGHHQLQVLMNDDVSITGYNWQMTKELDVRAAQVMVLSFKEGFVLQ